MGCVSPTGEHSCSCINHRVWHVCLMIRLGCVLCLVCHDSAHGHVASMSCCCHTHLTKLHSAAEQLHTLFMFACMQGKVFLCHWLMLSVVLTAVL